MYEYVCIHLYMLLWILFSDVTRVLKIASWEVVDVPRYHSVQSCSVSMSRDVVVVAGAAAATAAAAVAVVAALGSSVLLMLSVVRCYGNRNPENRHIQQLSGEACHDECLHSFFFRACFA